MMNLHERWVVGMANCSKVAMQDANDLNAQNLENGEVAT